MSTRTLATFGLASLLGTAALINTALAASSDEKLEATALQGVKITLTEAIAIAEQRTGGQAFDAGADVKSGSPRIAVETNGSHGIQTVTVDARSGQVISIHAGGEQD